MNFEELKSFIKVSFVLALSDCEHFYVRNECFISFDELQEWLLKELEDYFKRKEELEKLPLEARRAIQFINVLNVFPVKEWDRFIEV